MITIRSRRGLFLVILLLLTACRQVESNSPITPTPFQETLPRHRISSTEPIAISLAHLAANPEFFEGSTLQLAGEYQKLPILSCKRDPHPGPASWGIVGDGLLANASGQDAQLRSLLAKNQWIVAEGRWLHYVGPVGCGKSAPVQEVWYLSVNRILEPHPLARAGKEFLPENGAPTPISEMPDNADVPGSATDDGLLNSSGGEATASPSFLATNTPEQSISPTTNPVEATITPSFNPNESPSPSVTADFNTPDVSETPTLTTTVTVTPGPTPTPSLTPEGLSFNNRGPIDFEDLKIEMLDSGVQERWTLPIDTSDSITITVAPASTANIFISVIDENGAIIVDAQDRGPAGEVETIEALNLREPGIYEIYINTEPAMETDYALMVMNSESYSFDFRGTLIPSSPRSDSLKPDNDHFWFFSLSEGSNISIRVIPDSQADPYLELYDPQGSRVLTIDNTNTGETELLEDYEALTGGLFSIRVGEFDFAAMSYQILLTRS